jgi:putative FmdB family regulatory protein
MSTQEYKCQNCKMEFVEQETCGQQTTPEPKCPMCGGTKVRKLTEAESLVKRALGSMRGG